MEQKIKFITLIGILLSLVACEDKTGSHIFPKNEYQTVEQLQDGAKTNDCFRARTQLKNSDEESVDHFICETSEDGTQTIKKRRTFMKRNNGKLTQFTDWATSYITKDKATREAAGGASCKCEPMGESCAPKSCTCGEICPADSTILKSKSTRIRPTIENSVAFGNSSSHNDGAYETYPLTGGYCSGHVRQRQKFTYLADFQPDLRTIPKMKVGDRTFKKYTKYEIDRFARGERVTFQGIKDFEDLKEKDPESYTYLLEKLKLDDLTKLTKGRDGHYTYPSNEGGSTTTEMLNKVKFENPELEKIPGTVAKDDLTGKKIPPMHDAEEYREYMRQQVTMVSRYSQPAVIPGYNNLLELSGDPQYQEIIGTNTAIDWKHYGALDDDMISREGRITERSGYNDPMTTNQMINMMKTVEERLPEFDPSKPINTWNEDGPYETMPLSFRAKNKKPDDSTKDLYHAVEAWGFRKMPDGKKRICIADPNSTLNNDNCGVYFEIDESEGANPRTTYSRWPYRNIGKMMLSPSANGQNGRYMHQLTHACRIKNKGKFYSKCKEVDDVHCGEKDYTTVDLTAVEANVNSSIDKQKTKLQEGDE